MGRTLELEIASESVKEFHDDIMEQHAAAMECYDCQDHLQKGINSYQWLVNAEATIREATVRGMIDDDEAIRGLEAVYSLHQLWLYPCKKVETWVETLSSAGYIPDNIDEFRKCCESVNAWMEEHQWREKSRQDRSRRFAEEPF